MWYVYLYKNPIDGRVFYIGKGKKNRCKVHLYRTKTWIKKGKPSKYGSNNLHLLRLISQIWDNNKEPLVEIIKYFDDENESYLYEIEMIKFYKDSICNLTLGGEGFSCNLEACSKMSKNRKEWLETEQGIIWKKMMSESRIGSKNPNYGKKEDEDHKISRMKNMLHKERWNKGLSGDLRCKGPKKGTLPHNARPCKAINEFSGEIIEAESVGRLAKKLANHQFSISGCSITRIIDKNKTINGWKIIYVITL